MVRRGRRGQGRPSTASAPGLSPRRTQPPAPRRHPARRAVDPRERPGCRRAGPGADPEIQYLAYLHDAIKHHSGGGARASRLSNGQYRNPLVVRIAGYAYQRGSLTMWLRDDNTIASAPRRPRARDRVRRTRRTRRRCCERARRRDRRRHRLRLPRADRAVPPTATSTTTATAYGSPLRPAGTVEARHVPIGSGRLLHDGDDVLIVTWANGLTLSLRAARELAQRTASRAGCSTCAGLPRCRSPRCSNTPNASGGSSWSTNTTERWCRRGHRDRARRGRVPRAGHRVTAQVVHPARRRRQPRPRRRGRDRRGRPRPGACARSGEGAKPSGTLWGCRTTPRDAR